MRKAKLIQQVVPLDFPLPRRNTVPAPGGGWCTVPWTREARAEARAAATKTVRVNVRTGKRLLQWES